MHVKQLGTSHRPLVDVCLRGHLLENSQKCRVPLVLLSCARVGVLPVLQVVRACPAQALQLHSLDALGDVGVVVLGQECFAWLLVAHLAYDLPHLLEDALLWLFFHEA